MEKGKVVGILSNQSREPHALLEVIAFQKDGRWITEKKSIKEAFPPEEKVFAPIFFNNSENANFKVGSCLEFPVEESPTASENERNAAFQIPPYSKINPKWSVYPCYIDLVDEYGAINFTNLQYSLADIEVSKIEISPTFYLDYKDRLYGPFKDQRTNGGGVEPKSGKSVRCWSKRDCELVVREMQGYLLRQPEDDKGEEIDCMTQEQLISWLQTMIRPILDIKPYKKALLELSDKRTQEPFLKSRVEKFAALFQQQDQSLAFLQQLTEAVPELRQAFEKQLHAYKDELLELNQQEVNEELSKIQAAFDQSKNELDSEQNRIGEEINGMTEQYSSLLKHLDELEKEMDYLKKNRERLVKDFQLLLPALAVKQTPLESVERPLPSYSINSYRATSEIKVDRYGFQEQLQEILAAIGLEQPNGTAERSIELMGTHRIIFAPYIQFPLAIANACGNADCIIQQVEPDWLTYHQFQKAVLGQVLARCQEYPDRFIFLILQDINIASPECYARPFLEVHAGIRHTFPGTDLKWPRNLWTFLLIAPSDLGLPMASSTFTGCAGLPKKTPDTLRPHTSKSSASKQLPVDYFDPPKPAESKHFDTYFDE